MDNIFKHKLNCDNCIWGDQICRIETQNQKCRHYYPIEEESIEVCIKLFIEENRRIYEKDYKNYLKQNE